MCASYSYWLERPPAWQKEIGTIGTRVVEYTSFDSDPIAYTLNPRPYTVVMGDSTRFIAAGPLQPDLVRGLLLGSLFVY